MPRVTFSSDHLLSPTFAYRFNQYSNVQSTAVDLSPSDINKILSRKLYDQLRITPTLENERKTFGGVVDIELVELIDQFFNLAYLNTIPIVNLLATAVATNFLKENLRELDNRLQQQLLQQSSSLFDDPDEDDSDHSWASAPG